MKILYVFPHPDDESFGPAAVMAKQVREGHEVYLLTLTKGGATKQRFEYNYSIEQMGEVRYNEMLNVAAALDLTELKVLDLPDSGLKELDPRLIEIEIKKEIERIKPNVIVSYAVHGISGFFDHLVAHAVVKRAYVNMKEQHPYLKRLAFYTIAEDKISKDSYFKITGSKLEDVDCIIKVDDIDLEKHMAALDCYVTYREVIEKTKIKEHISKEFAFEIFQEEFSPPLSGLFEKLKS